MLFGIVDHSFTFGNVSPSHYFKLRLRIRIYLLTEVSSSIGPYGSCLTLLLEQLGSPCRVDGIIICCGTVDINLCAGCSLEGLLGEPMWQVRHVNDFQLDFIHFKPASSANGPIIGNYVITQHCISYLHHFLRMYPWHMTGQ